MTNALSDVASVIAAGLPGPKDGIRVTLEKLFGSRYHSRHQEPSLLRDAYGLSASDGDGVPFAGMINPDNPPSGPYGGTSFVWFPTQGNGSLVALGIGTRGLSPDEGILTRPGHRRRLKALRRYLAHKGIHCWTKPDPAALGVSIPKTICAEFPDFDHVFKRYGREIYCLAHAKDEGASQTIVQAFLDLYAFERGWSVLKDAQKTFNEFHSELRNDLFPAVTDLTVNDLLRARRFVVLQGPPGTGKTRLAGKVSEKYFKGHGMTIQFHPAVTYEDFVVGLSPDASKDNLRFDVRPGWLLQAAQAAKENPFVLIIDEVNRADLGKVLGEAIYLFEADEIGGANAREVRLAHAIGGQRSFKLPENLYVLATMNTADRSIAGMDLAVRRRFAFVTMPPDRQVVAAQALPLATEIFDKLMDVFVEHSPDDALELLPGHAYYLAKSNEQLRERFRYELLPLLDEYLREGFLAGAASELHAVRDALEDVIQNGSR